MITPEGQSAVVNDCTKFDILDDVNVGLDQEGEERRYAEYHILKNRSTPKIEAPRNRSAPLEYIEKIEARPITEVMVYRYSIEQIP